MQDPPLPPMIAKILSTRKADCAILPDEVIVNILEAFKQDHATEAPRDKLQSFLRSLLRDAVCESSTASQRRASWMSTQWLLQTIDDAVRSARKLGTTIQSINQPMPQARPTSRPSERAAQGDERDNIDPRRPPTISAVNGHLNETAETEASRKRRWGEPLNHSHATNGDSDAREASRTEKRVRQGSSQTGQLERGFAAMASPPTRFAGSHVEHETTGSNVHSTVASLHTALKASRKPPALEPARSNDPQSTRVNSGIQEKTERRPSLERDTGRAMSVNVQQRDWQRGSSRGSPRSSMTHSQPPDSLETLRDSSERSERSSDRNMSTRWEPPSRISAPETGDSPEPRAEHEQISASSSNPQASRREHNMSGREATNDPPAQVRRTAATNTDLSTGTNVQTSGYPHKDAGGHHNNRLDASTSNSNGHSDALEAHGGASHVAINAQHDAIINTVQCQGVGRGQVIMTVSADSLVDGSRNCYSGAIKERPPMTLTFVQSPTSAIRPLVRRMLRWDPFWQFEDKAQIGRTFDGVISKPNRSTGSDDVIRGDGRSLPIKTAMRIQIRPDRDLWTQDKPGSDAPWGNPTPRDLVDGSKAILLRMMPVTEETKSRAGCHVWPRGCFLQINRKPVKLIQRKQSNDGKWEGNCKALDLSPYIESPSDVLTLEMCCYDDEPYYFCLAVCSYRTPSTVFHDIMDRTRGIRMIRLSRNAGIQRAKQRITASAAGLDADNEVCAESRFTFSLICPISKQFIKEPVRGKHCSHWQCFDLRVFLESNAAEGRQRWRCAICDDFIPADGFVHCSLTLDMLDEFKDVLTPTRDRVEFRSDGTYELLPERRTGKKQQRRHGPPAIGNASGGRPIDRHAADPIRDQNVIVL